MRESDDVSEFDWFEEDFDELLSSLQHESAENQLELIQAFQDDYAELEDIFENALHAQQFCDDAQLIWAIFDGLKLFLHRQGHWGEAKQSAECAISAAKRLGDKLKEAEACFQCGLIADDMVDAVYEEAQTYYQQALQLADSVQAHDIHAEASRRMGWIAANSGNIQEAKTLYQQALETHQHLKDTQGEVKDRRQLAMLFINNGEFTNATTQLEQCELLFSNIDQEREASRLSAYVYLEQGCLACLKNDLLEAKQYLDKAYENAQKVDDITLQIGVQFQQSTVLRRLDPEVHFSSEAFRNFDEMLRKSEDKRNIAFLFVAQGNHALENEDLATAKEFYQKALEIGMLRERTIALMHLGVIAYRTGELEEAIELNQRAQVGFQKLGMQKDLADCYSNFGVLMEAREQWKDAKTYFIKSLNIRRQLNLWQEIPRSYEYLIRLYRQPENANLLKMCFYYWRFYRAKRTVQAHQSDSMS